MVKYEFQRSERGIAFSEIDSNEVIERKRKIKGKLRIKNMRYHIKII